MNKKLLLLALPAFMVLSGCGARGFEQPEERPEAAISEATVAQEEDAHEFVRTAPAKAASLNAESVKVGYQIQYSDNGDDDDTISIRFIAALKDRDVTAFWHRGLAQANGNEGADVGGGVWKYKFSDTSTHQSTIFYDALNNDGVRVVAGQGDYAGYECFAIYTLMNIPYETYKDSYLAAYVTLNGENTINSQAVAVKIERDGTASKNKFNFDPTITGHFLQGKINDQNNSFVRATENPGGNNFAAYYGINLLNTDSFGSFYYSPSHFQFFGYSTYFTEESKYNESSLGEYAAPKASGTYNLYLSSNENKHNHVYTAEGHIWTIARGSGDQIRLNACEENDHTKYFIENINVTAGEALHIYKDGIEDSTTYSVTENVSNNNLYQNRTFKNSGATSIYLNTDGGIWVSMPNEGLVTINIDIGTWAPEKAASHIHAWAWKDGVDGGAWYTAVLGEGNAATVQVPGHCDTIKLTRNGSNDPGWGWNTTCNVTIVSGKTLTVTGWDDSAEFK